MGAVVAVAVAQEKGAGAAAGDSDVPWQSGWVGIRSTMGLHVQILCQIGLLSLLLLVDMMLFLS